MKAALLLVTQAVTLSALIVAIARKAGVLTYSGALAALAGGVIAILAGWSWALFLACWFLVMSLVSRMGRAAKIRNTVEVVSKGGPRDHWQVLANGGVFFLLAFVSLLFPSSKNFVSVLAAASLAASGSDSAATEIGTWMGGAPLSLRTLRRVLPGTSGAISWSGTIAMFLAAGLISALACAFSMVNLSQTPIIMAAGIVGALADTLMGATLQERRRCLNCGENTEQLVHHCGASTVQIGGISWVTNDVVNMLTTVVAAFTAAMLMLKVLR